MSMHNYDKLIIWKESVSLVNVVYKTTHNFPSFENFGLTQQIRRSLISIPSNIAEGSSRSSQKDFKRFIEIAMGSAFELHTQLLIAYNPGYYEKDLFDSISNKLNVIIKQIHRFKETLTD